MLHNLDGNKSVRAEWEFSSRHVDCDWEWERPTDRWWPSQLVNIV